MCFFCKNFNAVNYCCWLFNMLWSSLSTHHVLFFLSTLQPCIIILKNSNLIEYFINEDMHRIKCILRRGIHFTQMQGISSSQHEFLSTLCSPSTKHIHLLVSSFFYILVRVDFYFLQSLSD